MKSDFCKQLLTNISKTFSLCCLASGVFLTSFNSHALGPVDGEIGLQYWSDSVNGSFSDTELDAGTGGIYGELWLSNKWGIRANYYRNPFEDTRFESSGQLNLDIKRRFLSPTDNSYFAIGLGYENLDLKNSGSSSGPRLVADGRLGLVGILYFYGQFAWIPVLQSFDNVDDIEARETEFGLVLDPLPFLSLRLGYRNYDIDHNLGSTGADGLIFAGGIHW